MFSEARIPLLADKPFARDLSAELGLRYSRYDSVGSTWTYKALGDWSPVGGLRFRGGYQRAVRAPAASVCRGFERDEQGFPSFMDQSTANIPFIRVRGIDWQLNYRRDLPWGLLGERDRAEINLTGTRY